MTADAAEYDVASFDLSNPIAGIDDIRAVNPHRHEFEMLTAVVLMDPARKLIVGYKDVGPDAFWARGHMPGFPLMPGVLMVEAAAQLCCYFSGKHGVTVPGTLMGLGGIEDSKFLRPVRPGDRLVLVGTALKVHRRLTRFRAIGYVRNEKVFETTVVGVAIGKLEELKGA